MPWKRTRGLRYTLWDFYIQWGRRQADRDEVMCSYWQKRRLLRLNEGASLLGINSRSVLHFWALTEIWPRASARKIHPQFHSALASVEAWGPSVKSFWASKFEEMHPYMAVGATLGHKGGGPGGRNWAPEACIWPIRRHPTLLPFVIHSLGMTWFQGGPLESWASFQAGFFVPKPNVKQSRSWCSGLMGNLSHLWVILLVDLLLWQVLNSLLKIQRNYESGY